MVMMYPLLFAAHCALHVMASPGVEYSVPAGEHSAMNETQALLQQLADARIFSGVVAVQKAGTIVYTGGYGYAVEELGVSMKAEYIFPLGSQAKFYTTVAIHQLANEGHLNLSHPVAQYLDPADFPALQNRTWCPRVHGRENEGCQNVTVVDLLSMTSGILPSDMGFCEDLPFSKDWTPDEWYWQYRVTGTNMSYGDATGATGDYLEGTERLVTLLNRLRILEMPLLYAPKEGWCYDDANYNIVGYLVEKFSNMSLGEYIQKNVLTPANLTDTFYFNGAPSKEPGGLRKNMLPIPAYTTDFDGQNPPYVYERTNRYRGWSGELSFHIGAAGAMFGTASDSLKWYMTFLVHPEVLRLSKSEIKSMITPSTQPLRWANGTINPSTKDASGFAQGMSTHGSPGTAHGIEFTGGQWGFMVNTRIFQNDSDWAQSDGVAVFVNSTPHIPKSTKCTVVSPKDNSTVTLPEAICGRLNDEATSLTDYISSELAAIWNITREDSPASPAAVG